MSDLRTAVIRQQIQQHYPNARIVSYTDEDSDLAFYTEKQLQRVTEDWFPLACHRDPKTGKLVFGGRADVAHTYTIGETGAGKTTRFVMQSIRALADLPDKPSFLITDLHGEIIENLYTHLEKNGYTIKILNCDDPSRSDTYNPFASLVKTCQQTGQIDDEGHNMLRKIAELIQPVQSSRDPIWDLGACSYTHGCILDKFEALLAHEIPPKCVTLYNVIDGHYWLREKLGDSYHLKRIPYFAQKPRTALSVQKILAVTDNADRTRRSYWGVVENHYDAFGQPSMYRLSSNSTIDVTEFIEKPTAIIVQSGSSACSDHLVSLMVNDIYNTIVRKGRQQRTKRLPRPVHCFLDEFANCHITEGPAFVKMLTTSRKFGMYWHMLLQSDAQMESKYDRNIADIIRANCTEIFFGSYDYDTASRFAQSCGKTTIESLATRTTQQAPVLEITDLITPDRLNLMEPGWAYIRSRRHPLLHTYYEAFYNCKEYAAPKDVDAIYPHNQFDYRLTAFVPDDLVEVSKKELAVLERVHQSGACTETELTAIMPITEVGRCLRSLQAADMITCEDGTYRLKISPWHLELLKERCEKGEKACKPLSAEEEIDLFDLWNDPLAQPGFPGPEIPAGAVAEEGIYGGAMMDVLLKTPIGDLKNLETAAQFTCIPQTIADNMRKIAQGRSAKRLNCGVNNLKILKFEILEAFITRNDFKRKDQWVRALRDEVRCIKENGWFSETMIQQLNAALRELDEELTLGNIREIKKIVSGDI